MKVGDYVRTKDGVIAKITDILEDLSIDCDRDVYDLDDIDNLKMMEIPYCCKDEYIIKSSPNIIDLIEVGDYVNGYKIIDIVETENGDIKKKFILQDKIDSFSSSHQIDKYISNEDIKSIVTKEQFERIEYKL